MPFVPGAPCNPCSPVTPVSPLSPFSPRGPEPPRVVDRSVFLQVDAALTIPVFLSIQTESTSPCGTATADGVGEGVLKQEIRSYLDKQEGVEYFDADFREYGKGATTIEIHYNYKVTYVN